MTTMPQALRTIVRSATTGVIATTLILVAMNAQAQDDQREQVHPLSLKIQQDRDIRTPRRGEAKDSVENRFGEPESVKGPIGDPPITRWQYAGFEVVFEGDWVIHTVIEPDTDD